MYIIIFKYSEPTLFLDIWKYEFKDSQAVPVVKNSPANAGETSDVGSIPGLGSCPGGGNGNNLLQYSCLENVTLRGARQATVHEVEKNWTQLSNWARTCTVTQRKERRVISGLHSPAEKHPQDPWTQSQVS